MKHKKKTTAPAKKPIPSHPTVGGKAPRKSFPTHPPTKSIKVPKQEKNAEKLPYTEDEALAARFYQSPTKEEAKNLRETKWRPESFPLSAERVKEPEELEQDIKKMRVINEFSFWLERTAIAKGPSNKVLRPTAPIPGVGEPWSDFVLRGRAASLNGPARYLAMAGEFFVKWPTMDSFPLELKKGEIEDIVMIDDEGFRDGKPSLAVITEEYIYFLLTPDFFFEKPWESVVPFWESYMEAEGFYIEDIDHRSARQSWWHGRKSHRAYRRWKVRFLAEEGESPGTFDTSRDRPQPGDQDDDEFGLDDFSDYTGSESSWSEKDGGEEKGEEGEQAQAPEKVKVKVKVKEESAKEKGMEKGTVGPKGKKKKVPQETRMPGGMKQQRADNDKNTLESKEPGPRDQTRGKRKSTRISKMTGEPGGICGDTSVSKLATGTGPPKRLAIATQAPATTSSKRKAADDHAKPLDAVRPRHGGPSDEEETPSGLPTNQGLDGDSAENTNSESQETSRQLPVGPETFPTHHPFDPPEGANTAIAMTQTPSCPVDDHIRSLSNLEFTARLFGLSSEGHPQIDGAGSLGTAPQMEGVSRGFGSLQLSSNAPIAFAHNLGWNHGWGVPQPYTGGSQPAGNMMPPVPDIEYDPADGSVMTETGLQPFPCMVFGGTDQQDQQFDPGMQYHQLQMVESTLQQNADENLHPFDTGAPHDQYFPLE
ncbi:hypothetical protein FRC11_012891 [Ceratobasidium sp. 423]|nr:hypothetical protein FRC11_012891 [Ceratobasidium sp. 423]